MNIRNYIQKSLLELGLNEGEAKVYFCILQAKGVADTSFIQKRTRYSTAGTYKVLDSLIAKGFIVKNASWPATYSALPLENISKKMALKGRQIGRTAAKFAELGKMAKIPVETDIFEEGELTDFYLNIPYKIDDFIWCIGSFEAVVTFFGPEIEKEFIKMRSKKGKHADAVIFDNSSFSKDLAGRDTAEKRETKIIAHNDYPLEFSYLFNNTVLDFYKDMEGKVKVLKTESPDVAKGRLIQYQQLWNSTPA